MADVREYKGVLVSASGRVFRKDGSLIKPQPVFRKTKKGKELTSFLIEYNEDGEEVNRGYQRFVYAAFNPSFDIDRTDLYVISTNENKYEIRVKYLKEITRKQHHRDLGEAKKLFTNEQRETIAKTYWETEGTFTKRAFAKKIGTTDTTLNTILREYPNENTE